MRNLKVRRKFAALAMATTFTITGIAAQTDALGNYPVELSKGHYYNEDVKENMRELELVINGGEKSKEKVYTKNNKMRLNYR